MKQERLPAGSRYEVGTSPEAPPCFVYRAPARAEVERRLRGQYVELSLRLDVRGRLAWTMETPDRAEEPWAIPIAQADLPRLAETAAATGRCPTWIHFDDGEPLDLSPFSDGLTQDWTGRLAEAVAALIAGESTAAQRLARAVVERDPEVAAAHHLLGRCAQARGEHRESIACHQRACIAASRAGRLLPFAAGPLSDLAVAFKREGDPERATHLFLRSLALRPNHPEALLSFFSMCGADEQLVLYGAARVLAIGGSDALVETYLCNYAAATGAELSLLLPMAHRLAHKVELTRWPFASERFLRADTLDSAFV